MITKCKTNTQKVLLDLMLKMQPLENKLESTALKRALTLKTGGHWNTQSIKSKISKNTRKSWLAISWCYQIKPNIKFRQNYPLLLTKQKLSYSNWKQKQFHDKRLLGKYIDFHWWIKGPKRTHKLWYNLQWGRTKWNSWATSHL